MHSIFEPILTAGLWLLIIFIFPLSLGAAGRGIKALLAAIRLMWLSRRAHAHTNNYVSDKFAEARAFSLRLARDHEFLKNYEECRAGLRRYNYGE